MEILKSLWKTFYVGLFASAIILFCVCLFGGVIWLIAGAFTLIFSFSKIVGLILVIVLLVLCLGAFIRGDLS